MPYQTDLILGKGDFPSMLQGIVTGSDAAWSHQNSKCDQSWPDLWTMAALTTKWEKS